MAEPSGNSSKNPPGKNPPAAPTLAEQWNAALAEQGVTPPVVAEDMAAEWASMLNSSAAEGTEAGGERVLNQAEIDALLGFSPVDPDGGGQGGIRSIVDSGVVSHERLPMLEIIFDRMVRLLATSLRNFFSDNVEVSLTGITSCASAIPGLHPLPTLLAVVRAEEWENLGLIDELN
jgi:flagellar motor switch protein FliM